jgi:protease PrsW
MSTTLTLILGLLPGFAWLFFYLQEDPHPEPKPLIALTFIMGAASAIIALVFEVAGGVALRAIGVGGTTVIALLLFSLIEEGLKFGAAYFSVHRRAAFDEPIDAVIYTVVAALGFATIENLGAIHGNSSGVALISAAFETASFRFVGATLLHTLTSGLIGYYWALSIRNFGRKKLLVFGILLGTVLHAMFNYLILQYGIFMYALIFVAILGFFAFHDFEKLRNERV